MARRKGEQKQGPAKPLSTLESVHLSLVESVSAGTTVFRSNVLDH